MSDRHFDRACLVLFATAFLLPAAAQEGSVTFEFSFSNPGARSLALGGAFAGLADDATAAFANPAGLSQLIEPEVSAEVRYSSYRTPFVRGGRASGQPTSLGVDTVDGLRYGTSKESHTGLSYFSSVLPRTNWSIALYRHTWADFTVSSRVGGLFMVEDGEQARSEDVTSRTDVRVVNLGVAASYNLSRTFRVGLGLVHFDARLTSRSKEYNADETAPFATASFDRQYLDTIYSTEVDDT